jgi:hypothetical protein
MGRAQGTPHRELRRIRYGERTRPALQVQRSIRLSSEGGAGRSRRCSQGNARHETLPLGKISISCDWHDERGRHTPLYPHRTTRQVALGPGRRHRCNGGDG